VSLRLAREADAAAVAAIWNHYIRETTVTFNPVEKSVAEVAQTILTRPVFFVAERDGRIAGFSTYGEFRPGVGNMRSKEHSILLAPGAVGGGLGRALLTAVEDHARAAGAHSLFGGVSAENAAGRAFHARMGYAEAAVLRDVGWKFGRYIDLVLMQKFLS
jgi:phosphinothricin acetyltransferase